MDQPAGPAGQATIDQLFAGRSTSTAPSPMVPVLDTVAVKAAPESPRCMDAGETDAVAAIVTPRTLAASASPSVARITTPSTIRPRRSCSHAVSRQVAG